MYEVKSFSLGELPGLSAKQVEAHLGLYTGYVKNVNRMLADITEYKKDSEKNAVALSEIMRRFAFEFNGMRLHELYFEQFEKKEGSLSLVGEGIVKQWGSEEAWSAEFKRVGMMRGIGWVLLVRDEATGRLMNIWVSDHELGHLAGTKVLLAMDVWEHAYLLDYLPSERAKYIESFFSNLSWQVVESRG